MSKKKDAIPNASNLPPEVRDAATPPPSAELEVPMLPTPELHGSVAIEVPVGEFPEGFLSRHAEARLATDRQRRNLRRMLVGLRALGAKLENGRFVNTQADAMKWLLERLG